MDIYRHQGFTPAKTISDAPVSAFSLGHFVGSLALSFAAPVVCGLFGLPLGLALVAPLVVAAGGAFMLWGSDRFARGRAWSWVAGALAENAVVFVSCLLFGAP